MRKGGGGIARATVAAGLVMLIASATVGQAALSARITGVVREVVVRPQGTGAAADPDKAITTGAVVRTGVDSRAELTFSDRTVTRLGAKTLLRVGQSDLRLEDGALLFQSPRGSSPANVRTGTIVIQGAGATGIVERFGAAYAKILILQGTARVFLPAKVGESILVEPGQMLIMKPEAKSLPEPVDFDIGQLYRTSVLIGREFGRLTSQPQIAAEIAKQRADPSLVPTNLLIRGRGTTVTVTGPAAAEARATPSPSPRGGTKPDSPKP